MSHFFAGNNLQLNKHEGGSVSAEDALTGKHVLFYFSAHWCPPCRGFTPSLSKFYTDHHERLNFEIVFVSSDKDEKAFNEYWGTMPFLALPLSDKDQKAALSQKYGVTGIPMLVVVAPDGSTVTTGGRAGVTQNPDGAGFPWA